MELLQVALRSEDLDRTARFYEQLLGERPAARFESPGLLFFRFGNSRLLFEERAPAALVYIRVPDLEAALARVPDGAERVGAPQLIFTHPDDAIGPAGTEEWHAAIRDPDGNLVVFVELVH
jgi:methylmalonyl-CoA/ethylmalonyl-CoA epimerase